MISIRHLSIKTQLLIMMTTTVVILSLVFSYLYIQVTKLIIKNNEEYTDDVMYQIVQTVTTNCELLERILIGINYDTLIQDYVTENDSALRYDLFTKLNANFLNMMNLKEGILDLVILGSNGTTYFYNGRQEAILDVVDLAATWQTNYYSDLVRLTYNGQDIHCFMLISDIISIRNDETNGKKIGVAALVFDSRVLGINLQNSIKAPESRFYLVDRTNVVYSGTDNSALYDRLNPGVLSDLAAGRKITSINRQDYLIQATVLTRFEGKVFSLVPQNVLFGDLRQIRTLMIILIIVSGLVLFSLFAILTRRLLQTNSRMYELELQNKQSEIEQLKSQINPHFLYNSLESMKGVALSEKSVKVFDMISNLARLFYYSFRGADIVRVSDELSVIRAYVHIQQIRFEGRFIYEEDLPDDVLSCRMPKMILQPIVENAVFHGLERKVDTGHLRIVGRLDGTGNLIMMVIDDGIGIDTAELAALQAKLREDPLRRRSPDRSNGSIGLINVHNRIRLLYGASFGLSIESNRDRGSVMTIKLPAQR